MNLVKAPSRTRRMYFAESKPWRRHPMKLMFQTLISLIFLLAVATSTFAQWRQQTSNTTSALRGLSAVSDQIVWASGTKGTFVRTTDGGQTWRTGTVPGAEELDFRDVEAFDANTAYLLSIGQGASSRIYKTTDGGRNWKLQFKNSNPDAFFDGLAFWDSRHGIAMSDPVNGKFLILITDDGGATWKPVEGLPPALPSEGGFAASGSSIAVQGHNNVWFVTGGAGKARVFRSTDRGRTWTVAETSMRARAASAGIFSIAFKDSKRGVIVGGDYQKPSEAENNIAFTTDGGQTWHAPDAVNEGSRPNGFRSCVVYARGKMIAVGTSGSDHSTDGGNTWVNLDRENYNVVSFAASAKGIGWAAGPKGRIAKFIGQS